MRCRFSRYLLPVLALTAVLALAAPRLADAQAAAPADAQAPAATYRVCVASRPIDTVGIPIVMFLAPQNGPWPPGVVFMPIATGLPGTFIPASAVGAGTALLRFVFIPSAPGDGTLGATNDMKMLGVPLAPVAPPPGSKLDMSAVCSAARQVLAKGIPV